MINAISRNTIIQLSGKIVSTIFGLAIVALMTRQLGQAGYGQYVSVVAFLQFFGILIDFGLTMTVARELGRQKYQPSELLGNLLSFRVITGIIAFILAPAISLFLPYSPLVKAGIIITSLAFFASTISQCFSGVFQSKLATGRLVASELAGRIILLAGTWWAVSQQASLTYYFIILTISSLITAAITLIAARQLIPFKWQINPAIWRYLWQSTWPVAATIALNLIYFKTDTIILSWVRSEAEVGVYGAAYKVLEVMLAVPAIIGGLILPLAARAQANKNKNELLNIYQGTFDILLAGGLALIAGSIITGTDLIVWLAGADFVVAGRILAVLSLATAFIFIGNATGYIIFALDEQRRMIPYYAAAAALGLVGYAIFIPLYSYWGAAWMTVAVEAFMALVGLVTLWRLGLKPSPARWKKIIVATLIMSVGLLLPLPLLIKIAIAIILYVMSLWLLKLLPPPEVANIT
ncbi:MAG: flippase [Patescibacteria group bacterium]